MSPDKDRLTGPAPVPRNAAMIRKRRRKAPHTVARSPLVGERQPAGPATPVPADGRPVPATASLPVRALWFAGAALTFWSLGFNTLRGSDVWWHIAAGRWIVEHRALPRTDAWSYTAFGRPWLNHEWLGELVFGVWTQWGGMRSLVWLEWLLIVATLMLMMSALHRLTGDRAAAWAATMASGAVASYFFEIRPHLFSLLGLALVLAATVGRERASWWLPAVFLPWTNIHPGFIFGMMALCLLLAIDTLRHRERIGRNILLGAACFAATLVNPDGADTWIYTLRSAASPNAYVARLPEWLPPFHPGALYAPLFPWAAGVFAVAVAVTLLHAPLRRARFTPESLALGLLALAMALKACRFIPLFSLSAGLTVAPVLALALALATGRALRRIPAILPPLAIAAFGLLRLSAYPVGPSAFHHMTLEETFPVDTCDFIEANHLSGKVFNYYGWGGYLILRTDGRLKVFIDGRGNIVFEDKTFERYLRVLDREADWLQVLEASGADYILWPTEGGVEMLQHLVDSGRWIRLHQDFVSVILCRADRMPPGPLKEPPPSAWRELGQGGQARSEGRQAEAEARLRRALQLAPDLRPAALSLASLLLDRGDRTEALAVLRRQEHAFPSHDVGNAIRHVNSGAWKSGLPMDH